jgi:hypothetical protein
MVEASSLALSIVSFQPLRAVLRCVCVDRSDDGRAWSITPMYHNKYDCLLSTLLMSLARLNLVTLIQASFSFKIFREKNSIFLITLNLWTYVWSIKYR